MDDIVTIVNQTLDLVRQQQKITSDNALAKHLQVSDLAIYRWRNGELPKAARILIPLIISQREQTEAMP